MKKTYISPELLVVKFASKQAFLQGSYTISNEVSSTDAWVKEDYPPISDKSVWDEEW